jgi:N-acetylneuraminic acid mutarotase
MRAACLFGTVALFAGGCGLFLGDLDVSVSIDGGASLDALASPEAGGENDGGSPGDGCVDVATEICPGKCGVVRGACGGTVDCGGCQPGQNCGGGGPNVCGTATCTPSCAGKACGASDGCAGVCNPAGCTTKTPKIVLFGGHDGAKVLGDTWEWDGTVWTPRTVAGPSARQYHAMASLNGKVVLFGGYDGVQRLGDTWEWDGSTWTKRDVVGPSPRRRTAMATIGAKIVLYGGTSLAADGGTVEPTDTWEWDGNAWTPRTGANPGGRADHRMAALGANVFLHGDDGDFFSELEGETWKWDGTGWTNPSTTGPTARSSHGLAPAAGKIVLFGGSETYIFGCSYCSDTWDWDGTTWTHRTVTGPVGRHDHAIAALGTKAVLFGGSATNGDGGHVLASDTWEWDGTTWTPRPVTGPPARETHAMASY